MEIGNLIFNTSNKNQEYECPMWVEALLKEIESQISRVYWNKNQEEWDSAFRNTGNSFFNGTVSVQAYRWESEDEEQEYNFECNNIKISWYKNLGRDTTINISPAEDGFKDKIIEMFNIAIESIIKMEEDYGLD